MKRESLNLLSIVFGTILFSIGVNMFLQPLHIYSGGFLGVSQLLRNFLQDTMHIDVGFDISGYLNLGMNAFLVVFAYRAISKAFALKTCLTLIVQGVCLSLIPISKDPVVPDVFIGLCLGSFLVAVGTILVFDGGGSGAGLDIIGVALNRRNVSSISQVYLLFNSMVYLICLIAYNAQTAIYSLIHAVLLSKLMELLHKSNIEIQVTIISDNHAMGKLLMETVERGVTSFSGTGEYTGNENRVYLVVLTKDRLRDLKKLIKAQSGNNFMIVSDTIEVMGHFSKKIV